MAKNQNRALYAAVAAVVVGSVVGAVRADTLADWTFETSQPAAAGPFAAESGNNAATSFATGFHSSGAAVYSTPAGNGSAHSFSSNTWSVNDYYQFTTSTTGYNALDLQFDQTSSATGPGKFQLEYSTNGTAFTNFGPVYSVLPNAAPNPVWNAGTSSSIYTLNFDLSGITALNNQTTIYFRLLDTSTTSANGGAVAAAGTDRVDNIIISGTLPSSGTTLLWVGGNGAWDTTTTTDWSNGTSTTAWNNTTIGTTTTATFTTPSIITVDGSVGGGITANGLAFQAGSSGVSIGGTGNLTMNSGNISVAPATTATIGAPLLGSAGINVSGGGTLALTNTGNTFTGNVTVSSGTLQIGNDGELGDPSNVVNLAGGTFQATASLVESRTFNITALTSTLDDQGNNITISSPLTGTGPLSKVGTGTLTFSGTSATSLFSGGIAISQGTLVISNADPTSGISGVGTGPLTVSAGATLSVVGGLHLGRSAGVIAPSMALTPGTTGATFVTTGGTTQLDNSSSSAFAIGTAAGTVHIKSLLSTDTLIINSALRNSGGTISGATISAEGAGIIQVSSGAVSTSNTGNQYSGSWVVNMDQNTGILTAGPILPTGVGEVLNAFGYAAPAVTGTGAYAGTTNPVTINSGTVAFGADQANQASASITLANSFRSPLTLNGGKIASTGLDYSGDGSADGTPVVANLAANITVNAGATSSVLLYDPVTGSSSGGRSLNIMNDPFAKETTGTPVSSNLTWGQNSTLVVVGSSVPASTAALNLIRDTGTVTVGSGATLQINSNATVVLGGAMDALTDGTHNVNVSSNGTLSVTAGAKHVGGVDGAAGIVTIANGASLTADHIVQDTLTITGTGSATIRPGGGNNGTSKLNTLSIDGTTGAWTANLNIGDNKLIIEAAAGTKTGIISQTRDQLLFGKTNAAGIMTASLPSNMGEALVDNGIVGKTIFGGVPVDANSVLVAPELLGDANIDGHVDLTDLSTVLNNFGTATLNWTSGNFDGAATIDLTDLSAVLNNFGLSNPNAGAASGNVAMAAPEPGSLALLSAGIVMLASRRRKP